MEIIIIVDMFFAVMQLTLDRIVRSSTTILATDYDPVFVIIETHRVAIDQPLYKPNSIQYFSPELYVF